MIPVRVKQGYDLKLEGTPARDLAALGTPEKVAILPEKIGFIRPRLSVSVGDTVKVGSALFSDKRNPDVVFPSPGAGRILEINFGPRRVVRSIVVGLTSDEESVPVDVVDQRSLDGMGRESLVSRLLASGFWPRIRALPFRDIAAPDDIPPKIVVALNDLEPFTPDPEVYLKGHEDLFAFGLKILGKLSPNVIVAVGANNGGPSPVVAKACGDMEPQAIRGVYPALDPGVVVYHTKRGPGDNRSWFLDGQDVVLLGKLMATGEYPTERIVVVAGSMARERRHVKTRVGVPLADLARIADLSEGACRYVVGGVFTGFRSVPEGYMGFYENALNLLPEGADREFLSLFRPGYRKPSFSRTFLSMFNRKPLISDCNTHGELRACIACNHCPPVCPVDIMPQLTYKCILAGDLDGALAHGLLDCVECGLCTYVCPAKIELLDSFKSARAAYYREQSR